MPVRAHPLSAHTAARGVPNPRLFRSFSRAASSSGVFASRCCGCFRKKFCQRSAPSRQPSRTTTTRGKRPVPASKRRKTVETAAATRFFAEHDITVTGSAAPPEACVTLEHAPFAPALVAALQAQGFTAPSAVQGVTWPLMVRGLDVLAIAGTGQGKTLAYLLPALSRSASSDHGARHRSAGPSCLVVVPTRELALQVQAEAHKFGGALGLRSVALHGGVPKDEQAQLLRQGADLVVATPGRLLDHLGRHHAHQADDGLPRASLRRCTSLVLDEADRLLEMGFEKDVRAIAAALPPEHQTILCSATWPPEVRRAAASLLRSTHVTARVGRAAADGSGGPAASRTVVQRVLVVAPRARWAELLRLLESFAPGGADDGQRAIVFSETKRDAHAIGAHCERHMGGSHMGGSHPMHPSRLRAHASPGAHCEAQGLPAGVLTGDHMQEEREATIAAFRAGTTTLLVATDVAARGLDVPGVARVICFGFPSASAHLHRVGRTGRAGAAGEVDLLFTRKEARHAAALVRLLEAAGQPVPDQVREWAKSKEEHLRDKAERERAAGAAGTSGAAGAAGAAGAVEVVDAEPVVDAADAAPTASDPEEERAAAAQCKREEKERKAKAFREHAEALARALDGGGLSAESQAQ